MALHAALALHLLLPLAPAEVLVTGDLHNHVRHVYESGLALREGQFPPVVAPRLNGQRLRFFQLYSGTAFLVPGALTFLTDAYTAFRLWIFLASSAAALTLAWLLFRLFGDGHAALLAAAAFQVASFPTHDLLMRGSLTEWLALQLAVLVLGAAYALLHARAPARPFVATVTALALFIPCHPLQTVLLGAVGGAWLIVQAAAERHGRTRLVLLGAAALGGLALSAWYWLPVARHWNTLKMTTWHGASAWGSYFTHLDIVLWPWARGFHLWPAWTPQLGAPLVAGLLGATLAGAWRRSRPLLVVVGVGWLLLLLIVTPRFLNQELPWLVSLLGLRRFQYSYRLLLPLTLLATLALAWSWSRLRQRPVLRGRWITALAVGAVTVHSLPYVWGTAATERSYALRLDEITAAGFSAPNSSFYGLVGTDYRQLGWTRAGALRLRETLALPQAGLPFDVRLEAPPPLVDLRVEAEEQVLAVDARVEDGRAVYAFRVTPARRFQIRFDGPDALAVHALRFRPQGDARWLSLPARVNVLDAPGPAWRARVVTQRAGPCQLPVAWFPGDRLAVDGRTAEHVSADRFLAIVDLPAGEHVVESVPGRGPWAAGVSLLGLAAAAAVALRLGRSAPRA